MSHIGVSDWSDVGILDLVTIASGQVDPRLPSFRDLPLIAPDHIESGTGRLIAVKTAAEQGAISGKYLVEPGDVIYSKIRPNLRKAHLATFRAMCSADMYPLRPKSGVNPEFILNTLLAKTFTEWAISASMRSGIPKINRAELAEFEFLAPLEPEQRAIGDALRNTDDLIDSLERLISKRRDIKQGVIQQLLTGRTRLPGFTGEWETRLLQANGSTYGGLAGKNKLDFGVGQARFVTFLDVIYNTRIVVPNLERVVVQSTERQNRVVRGDVLFNGSSETPEEVALSAAVDFDPGPTTYLNSFCFGYRLSEGASIDPTYLAYFFRASPGRALVASLAQGATRYNIARRKFIELAPLLPPLDEQAAIVSVLHDVDDEIATLATRLDKARAVKTGVMQELLTGRTRLPVEAAV